MIIPTRTGTEIYMHNYWTNSTWPVRIVPARRNYLNYDPDIWMDSNPIPFHYISTVRAQGKVVQSHAERKVSDKSIINIINSLWKKNNPEYWKEGNRAVSKP